MTLFTERYKVQVGDNIRFIRSYLPHSTHIGIVYQVSKHKASSIASARNIYHIKCQCGANLLPRADQIEKIEKQQSIGYPPTTTKIPYTRPKHRGPYKHYRIGDVVILSYFSHISHQGKIVAIKYRKGKVPQRTIVIACSCGKTVHPRPSNFSILKHPYSVPSNRGIPSIYNRDIPIVYRGIPTDSNPLINIYSYLSRIRHRIRLFLKH